MSKLFRSIEQRRFSRRIAKHIETQDGPLLLEGGTGLGKTRAYLAALAPYKKVAIVLPTHQLIDQLLASSDLTASGITDIQAFRPLRWYANKDECRSSNEQARQAQVLVCTSASVIIDQRLRGEYNGVTTDRDYIVFDEADQLPDMAALQSDFTITADDLKTARVKLANTQSALENLVAKPPKTLRPELRAAALIMLEAIESPAWYHSCGQNDDGGITLIHKLPGRLLKKISNRTTVAFISATLSIGDSFNSFKKAMGIEDESALSERIEPLDHGKLKFHTSAIEIDTQQWVSEVVRVIEKAPKPVLVATTSHEFTQTLANRLPQSVVRLNTESIADAALRIDAQGVLIAANAWVGLDLPIQWKSIVIPRIPFPRPLTLDGEVITRYLDSRDTATRRMRQVIGRGLRNPDSVCEVFILDGRYRNIESFVPARFASNWARRSQSDVIVKQSSEVPISASERDPLQRRAALKKHGRFCMSCDLVPKYDRELLLIDNRGITKDDKIDLSNVLVLCVQCRTIAASWSLPIGLKSLQKKVKEQRI